MNSIEQVTGHITEHITWDSTPIWERMDDLEAAGMYKNWPARTSAGTFRLTCLISAYRSELGPNHNKVRHAALGDRLAALDAGPTAFEAVTGSWEGIEEQAYLVVFEIPLKYDGAVGASVEFLRTMYALAREYQQDAVLLQYGDKAPAVLWQSVGPEFIKLDGRLTCVSSLEAHRQPGWTRRNDGSYWIVK